MSSKKKVGGKKKLQSDINNIVYNLRTSRIDDITYVNEALSYKLLCSCDENFKNIVTIFKQRKLTVLTISEVINPHIRKAFELTRMYKYDNIEPFQLYHGTQTKYYDSICTFNFNWRYSGFETNHHKYGKGVYFSSDPLYAAKFCKNNGVILITDVLIKKFEPGSENLNLPPKNCDTTTGHSTSIFVKYSDNEFIPKFVVRFVKD